MMDYLGWERHWNGRRKSNDYRSIADVGWNRQREFMTWNRYDKCFDLHLWSTVVVQVFPEKFRVSCGGWWTNLTRKKIRAWSGVELAGSYRGNYAEDHFVYYNGDPVSVFCNGMEFSTSGFPLKPVMPTARVLKRGATQEFTNLVRTVRTRLMPRMLLGEFDKVDADPLTEAQVLAGLHQFATRSEGLFAEEFTTDDLAGFFALRPQQAFGRPVHTFGIVDYQRTGRQRFEANIAAAKRSWLNKNANRDLYTTVPREFA